MRPQHPEGLAPFQRAWAADVEPQHASSDNEYGTGRLVFLYDPSVPEAWESAFRMVVFAQAPIEPLMGQDEFLPNVAWSWLIDALDSSQADYFHAAGTTTSVVSTGFGEMEDQGSGAQVEVRASWSPRSSVIGPHLEAWSEFVCMLAGFPHSRRCRDASSPAHHLMTEETQEAPALPAAARPRLPLWWWTPSALSITHSMTFLLLVGHSRSMPKGRAVSATRLVRI